jgi:hypothetical protein
MILCGMLDLCRQILAIVIDLFRPRVAVEAEILVLRQQIIVLRRARPGRVPLSAVDKDSSGLGLPPISGDPASACHRSA